MDIYLTVLIGLLGLCVGAIIGLGIDFKINHTYIVEMNNSNKEYLEKVIDLEKEYFNTIATDLAKAVDDINKVKMLRMVRLGSAIRKLFCRVVMPK